TAANPAAASPLPTMGRRVLKSTVPSKLTIPPATFVPPMSTPSATDSLTALPSRCSRPSAGGGEHESRDHQHTDPGAHQAPRTSSGVLPFAGQNSPDARGDDDQRHEQRPPEDGPELPERHRGGSIHHGASEPEQRHRRGEHP